MHSTQTINLQKTVEIIEADDFFDVLIIGGGPHALGLAARLREPRPAALYTDIEHSRLAFLQRPGAVKLPRQPKKPYNLRAPHPMINIQNQIEKSFDENSFPRLLALDASSPQWMGRWNGFFHHLDISHLRSPMFFHPSPADVDGLEAFARRSDREKECADSGGVEDVLPTVGQSQRGADKIRKRATRKKGCAKSSLGAQINERERSSYARPSSGVFQDFCSKELVERYQLGPVLRQETVKSLKYGHLHIRGEGHGRGFTVVTQNGKKYGAKFVVVSIGGQESPSMPKFLSDYHEAQGEMLNPSVHKGPGWCHSRCFSYGGTKEFKEAVRLSKLSNDGIILVIGGGLTSAQIADLAIRKGASKVVFICRGYLKTKHYDFPLSWVTKYSNLEKMSFWQEDCRMARLKMVKQARNGGSVNPSTLLKLKQRVAEGTLCLHTHTSVTQATRCTSTGRWTLHLCHHPNNPKQPLDKPETEILENVAFIVCATGGKLDFETIPFLSSLFDSQQGEPNDGSNPKTSSDSAIAQSIKVPGIVEGLPLLTEDLQWGKELPLFVMGAYAALELGPDAGNLSGSRSGTERVASKLNELLEKEWFIESQLDRHPTTNDEQVSKPSAKVPKFSTKISPSDQPPMEPAIKSISENFNLELSDSNPLIDQVRLIGYEGKPLNFPTRQNRHVLKMGARERRAGNVGGWYAGLEEVVI